MRFCIRFLSTVTCIGLVLTVAPVSGRAAPAPREEVRPPAKRPGGREVALPLFRKGIAKFDGGYYQDAIKLFKEAMFHFPSPKIHTRIALCYKWLGNNLKALEHYEAYLKEAKEKGLLEKERVLVGKVKVEVKNLLLLIGQLRIIAEKPAGAEIRVNGKLAGTSPLTRTLRIPPGNVNVTVIKKGYYTFKRDVDVRPGGVTKVAVTLLKIKPKVVKIKVEVPYWKKWWFWTTVGVLAAGAATGAGLGYVYGRPKRELTGTPINQDSLGVRW